MADGTASAGQSTASHSGSGLSRRFGPLPLWAWVGVVVVGVIVWKIVRDRQAASASTTTASGTVGAADNASSLFGSEGFSTNSAGEVIDNATGDILGTFGGTTSGTGSSGGSTFATWASNAQQALFNLGFNNASVDQALQDYSSGQPLPQSEYNIIESAIKLVGNPPSGIALPQLQKQTTTSTSSSTGTSSTVTNTIENLLPELNAQDFAKTVLYGQYTSGEYTQIGTVQNGQYQGTNVIGGAPVYANVFGGFVQDFNMSTLPNGTGIYIPTSLTKYESTSGYKVAA